MVSQKARPACKQERERGSQGSSKPSVSTSSTKRLGRGEERLDKSGLKGCPAFWEPIRSCRKGYLCGTGGGGRRAPSYRGLCAPRCSNVLRTQSPSSYLCPGSSRWTDATEAQRPACVDRRVPKGPSLANTHLDSQEKTVFQPQ